VSQDWKVNVDAQDGFRRRAGDSRAVKAGFMPFESGNGKPA
jgi:hypothetical protein